MDEGYSRRDRIVVPIANWFLATFASKRYVLELRETIQAGLETRLAEMVVREHYMDGATREQ